MLKHKLIILEDTFLRLAVLPQRNLKKREYSQLLNDEPNLQVSQICK